MEPRPCGGAAALRWSRGPAVAVRPCAAAGRGAARAAAGLSAAAVRPSGPAAQFVQRGATIPLLPVRTYASETY